MLRKIKILVLTVMLLGAGFAGQASADAGFSLSVGTDDFYLSVGNYDYYSYSLPYYNRAPRISFYNVMADYGTWVSLSPFGQVWRPYVRSSWRPYVNGHWTYTRYGPTWVGYEPWAWAGYHYGNWIFSSRFGWVWIPGYDWHPGRVIWSHGYDTIGWMPAPPRGYDYSSGYLGYRGSHGQFDYYDDDFGYFDNDDYYYHDRYNSGYSNPFYGSGYRNIVVNLWVFIDVNHYRHHNYADYYLDSDYTRTLFDRRAVRISSRPIQRQTLERIVKHKIQETSVHEREIETDKRRVKVVVPAGEEENIRRNANRVVKKDIAPAFAEKRRNFKGTQSANAPVVNKVFKQENKQPKVKKQTVEEVLREIDNETAQVERQRKDLIREKTDKMIRSDEAAKARGKQQPQQKQKEIVRPGNSNNNGKNRSEKVIEQPKRNSEIETKSVVKPKQKERDLQFQKSQEKKQSPNPFEARPVPKKLETDESDSRMKQNSRRPEPGRKFEPVERNPNVEAEKSIKQENNGSAKRKVTAAKDEEQVEEQKKQAEKEKAAKKKKEDQKRKKQG
jgi:hypothetical protein